MALVRAVAGGVVLAVLVGVAPDAAAQQDAPPSLFDVEGVPAGELLNVREGPGVQHTVIGQLAADAEGVEVVVRDASGEWGQINLGEQAGWVALEFLADRADVWGTGDLPQGLSCIGTEPFWALRREGEELVLERPEAPELRSRMRAVLDTGVPDDPRRAVLAEGAGWRVTASILPRACSDGMSDRVYGLEAMVVREEEGQAGLLVGCCRLTE